MCFKASKLDRDESVERRDERHDAERQRPADNPRPPGNGELNHDDIERSVEQLTALVGR
jgi:hypothetical protein